MIIYRLNSINNDNTYNYNSDYYNNMTQINIYEKLFPFETFQFCNGFISDNDEH